jgi:hypothetical protein
MVSAGAWCVRLGASRAQLSSSNACMPAVSGPSPRPNQLPFLPPPRSSCAARLRRPADHRAGQGLRPFLKWVPSASTSPHHSNEMFSEINLINSNARGPPQGRMHPPAPFPPLTKPSPRAKPPLSALRTETSS